MIMLCDNKNIELYELLGNEWGIEWTWVQTFVAQI